MKKLIHSSSFVLAFVALWLTTGCQTVSTSSTQDLGVPTYPPTTPAMVQILRTEPTRPHTRIGQVRAEPSTESVPVTKIEASLQKSAAKMGADAVVIVYDKTQVVGAQVVGGWMDRSVETITGRVIVGVAIKYQ